MKDFATLKDVLKDNKALICSGCGNRLINQYVSEVAYKHYKIECHCSRCGNIWSFRLKQQDEEGKYV